MIPLRLRQRKGDVSDADWSFYRKAVEQWEELGPQTGRALRTISTDGAAEEALAQATAVLRELGLFE
jgi:predicted kinase